MDISSLLQEAPSNDRARRKQQQQQQQQQQREQPKPADVDNAPQTQHSGQYGYSRGSQAAPEYIHPGVGQAHPAHVPYSQHQSMNAHPPSSSRPTSSNYYPSHPDPPRLPINPPPGYVDVQTHDGPIRMKKDSVPSQQQQQQQQQQPLQPSPSLSFSQAYDFQHQQELAVLQQNRSHHAQVPAHSVPFNSRRPPAEESWKDDEPREPPQKPVINSFSIPHVVAPIPIVARAASPPRSLPLAPPPRTPSPRLDPVHLGSFVYPNLPFPIRPSTLPYNRRTTLAILVPASLLPTSLNELRSKRIWGGVPYKDERKIYTDDSDVVFAALHSGIVPWEENFSASGRDLELSLRLYPASETGRYFGGDGAAGLKSTSWGNAHEGCAFTIQTAIWVSPKTSYSYSRQTRKARMAEYAQRRADIMGLGVKSGNTTQESLDTSTVTLRPVPLRTEFDPIEVEMASLRIVGGWKSIIGFKYDPSLLRSMLFRSDPSLDGSPSKRRRLDKNTSNNIPAFSHSGNVEVVVGGPGTLNERLVLVSKRASSENSDKQEPDEKGKRKLEQDSAQLYDVYRERRDPPINDMSAQSQNDRMDVEGIDKATSKTKVRFAQEPAKLKVNWIRELVHSNVQCSDITFEHNSLRLGDLGFPAATWKWKNKDKSTRQRRSAQKKGRKLRGKKRKTALNAEEDSTMDTVMVSTTDAAPSQASPNDAAPSNIIEEQKNSPSEEGEIIET